MLDKNGDDVEICAKCGHYHIRGEQPGGLRLCPGHISGDPERLGEPCGHPAGWGVPGVNTGQCKKHGGSTKNAAVKAEKDKAAQVEKEVRKLLAVEDYAGTFTDPFSELISLAEEMKKLKSVLLQKVEELATLRTQGGAAVGETVDIHFAAYERAVERCERIMLGIARLDLTARIAQMNSAVDAATADMVKSALDGALDTLSLSAEDKENALRMFGTLLREEPARNATSAPQIGSGAPEVIDVGSDGWEPGDDDTDG